MATTDTPGTHPYGYECGFSLPRAFIETAPLDMKPSGVIMSPLTWSCAEGTNGANNNLTAFVVNVRSTIY